MCQTTHLKILGLVTFSDLTLTLTWAKYETISLVSTFAWSLGVHLESFGRKMLRLRSLRSATWKHPILTFNLTLTWHVTSISNFRKWFGSVSSRSFECRLVRLSTFIRFRDSRGGVGSDPPPGCGGYRNSPGGGGLKSHFCIIFLYSIRKYNNWIMKNISPNAVRERPHEISRSKAKSLRVSERSLSYKRLRSVKRCFSVIGVIWVCAVCKKIDQKITTWKNITLSKTKERHTKDRER